MSTAVRELLTVIDSLPESDQEELFQTLLYRQSVDETDDLVADLEAAARELHLMYEAEEATNATRPS